MRARTVTDADIALLRSVAREGSVVAASRSVGVSRDLANYRLSRLARAFGGAVVEGIRGGRGHGTSRLTELGDRILRRGFDSVQLLDARPVAPPSRSNRFTGRYRAGPPPEIEIGREGRLRVAFPATEGESVRVLIDPEAVLVARGRFRSSARNVLRATVASIEPGPVPGAATLVARWGTRRWRVAVTEETVRALGLAPGTAVWLYVKATAIRSVGRVRRPGPTRGSPRR
jgi:molybdate transport repressor ModE-like protein/molybdopterin-binding protein